jgi:hypothetical protein
MAIETVGVPQALLQLIASYEGLNGHRASVGLLWKEISSFVTDGDCGPLATYRGTETTSPSPQFLGDVSELLRSGFLRIESAGRLELTSIGRCLSSARQVPVSLEPLADVLKAKSEQGQ